MALTIGVQKLLSDQENVIVAEVLLGSDQIIANPLTALSRPEIVARIYLDLGISQDVYDIGQVSLSNIVSPFFSEFTYQFAMRFVKKGTKVTADQFIGPPGLPGKQGIPGRQGIPGPPGPGGTGSSNNIWSKGGNLGSDEVIPSEIAPGEGILFAGDSAGNTPAADGVPLFILIDHNFFGITGATGPKGATGPAGPTGPTGPIGPGIVANPGASAYLNVGTGVTYTCIATTVPSQFGVSGQITPFGARIYSKITSPVPTFAFMHNSAHSIGNLGFYCLLNSNTGLSTQGTGAVQLDDQMDNGQNIRLIVNSTNGHAEYWYQQATYATIQAKADIYVGDPK